MTSFGLLNTIVLDGAIVCQLSKYYFFLFQFSGKHKTDEQEMTSILDQYERASKQVI